MDINTFRGLITLLLLVVFIGIWAWAWSRKRKKDFDEAAHLPFRDEDETGKLQDTNKGDQE